MTGAMVTLLPVPAGEARWVRLLAVAAFGLVVIGAVLGVVMGEAQGGDGRLTTSDGDTVDVTGDARGSRRASRPATARGSCRRSRGPAPRRRG
jgi:hypothetical protein